MNTFGGNDLSWILGKPPVSAPTPAIYYPLSSTADTGAGGLTLTNTGGVTFVAGKVNNCASFTGLNNLNRADNDGFEPISSASWSMCCWINWSSMYGNLISKSAILADGWRLTLVNSKGQNLVQAHFYGSSAQMVEATITASTWTHYVVVVDRTANFLRIYKNGVLTMSESLGIWNAVQNSTAIQFGNTNVFKLDEAGFFPGTILSQADIDYIYNSGTGRTYSGGAWS